MPTITPEHMQAYRHMEKIIRAYDAAVTDNYNSDFKGTFTSANTEIFPHRYTIRARASDPGQRYAAWENGGAGVPE
jgi:hypothetical protein